MLCEFYYFLKIYLLSLCLFPLLSHTIVRIQEDHIFKELDAKRMAAALLFYFNSQNRSLVPFIEQGANIQGWGGSASHTIGQGLWQTPNAALSGPQQCPPCHAYISGKEDIPIKIGHQLPTLCWGRCHWLIFLVRSQTRTWEPVRSLALASDFPHRIRVLCIARMWEDPPRLCIESLLCACISWGPAGAESGGGMW